MWRVFIWELTKEGRANQILVCFGRFLVWGKISGLTWAPRLPSALRRTASEPRKLSSEAEAVGVVDLSSISDVLSPFVPTNSKKREIADVTRTNSAEPK